MAVLEVSLDLEKLNALVNHTATDSLFEEYYGCSIHSGGEWLVAEATDAPPLVALDCEMVCTTHDSMELGRISIMSFDGKTLYEQFILPENEVIDWRTFISGCDPLTAQSCGVSAQVARVAVSKLIGKETVIVGHALHHDLYSLRLDHHRVIDTAFLFPTTISNKKNQKKRISLPLRYLVHCLIEEKPCESFDPDSELIEQYNAQSAATQQPHDSMQDAKWALHLVLGCMKAYGSGNPLDCAVHLAQPYLPFPKRPRAVGVLNVPLGGQELLTQFVTTVGNHAECHPVWVTPPCFALKHVSRIHSHSPSVHQTVDHHSHPSPELHPPPVPITPPSPPSSSSPSSSSSTLTPTRNEDESQNNQADYTFEASDEKVYSGVSNLLFSTPLFRDKYFTTLMILLGAARQVKISPLPVGTARNHLSEALELGGFGNIVSVRVPHENIDKKTLKTKTSHPTLCGFVTFNEPESVSQILDIRHPSKDEITSLSYLSIKSTDRNRIVLNIKGIQSAVFVEIARVSDFVAEVPFFQGAPRMHFLRR